MPGGHVFLSYRSLERAFALQLSAALRNAGVHLWVDCLSEGIRPGDDWPQTLEAALNTCASMIAVLSRGYVASKICRRELHRADQLGRTIFPVLLEPLDATEWPLEVERLQYIDFTSRISVPAFSASVAALVDLLRGSGSPVIGQRPDPEQQYLLTLIANLEATGGVSQYVALDAELHSTDSERDVVIPRGVLEWGLDAEFTLLEHSGRERSATFADPGQALSDICDLVRTPHVFAIVGDPGAGKTTVLRRLALEVARSRIREPLSAPLPLLVSLPRWGSEPDALTFISRQWPLPDDPEPAIVSGDVAVFLDGLNEMGRDAASHAASLRQWIASPRQPRRLAVTCRAADYESPLLDLKIDRVSVKPMEWQRVQQFATAYLREDAPAFLRRVQPPSVREATAGEIGPRALFDIARNPYLLTCLIVLHRNSPDGELPRHMGLLFGRLVKQLWERERLRQTRGWVPYAEAEARLGAIAFRMIDENLSTTLLKEAATITLDDDLLHVCASANILVVEDHGVRFYHQLLQEYFAAVEIQRVGPDAVIAAREVLITNRWRLGVQAPGRWDEVLVALCGITSDIDGVLGKISERDLDLAARCLGSEVQASVATWQAVLTGLIDREVDRLDVSYDHYVEATSRTDQEAHHAALMSQMQEQKRDIVAMLDDFRERPVSLAEILSKEDQRARVILDIVRGSLAPINERPYRFR